MLTAFSVSNFLSFDTKQELVLFAGKTRKNPGRIYTNRRLRLVKCQTLFGANGSGKSNLIKALLFLQTMVIKGFPRGFSNSYCRLSEENRSTPSEFELEMICEDKRIRFGFTAMLHTGSILTEWLYEITPSGLHKYMYQRDNSAETFIIGDYFKLKSSIAKIQSYGEDSANDPDNLFLTIINQNKQKMYTEYPELSILRSVYNLIDSLVISFPGHMLKGYTYSPKSDLEEIAEILNALGTGISHIKYVDVSPEIVKTKLPEEIYNDIIVDLEKENAKNKKEGKTASPSILAKAFKQFYIFVMNPDNTLTIKTIEFEHEANDVFFNLHEESDGTARLLDLIEILLKVSNDSIYIIDEIDRCLHPSMTTKIISLFLEMAERRNTQLIVTTHESRLLKEDILRSDEISFMLKTPTGSTIVKPLEQYKLRSDKRYYEALFDGKNEVLPRFKEETLKQLTRRTLAQTNQETAK